MTRGSSDDRLSLPSAGRGATFAGPRRERQVILGRARDSESQRIARECSPPIGRWGRFGVLRHAGAGRAALLALAFRHAVAAVRGVRRGVPATASARGEALVASELTPA